MPPSPIIEYGKFAELRHPSPVLRAVNARFRLLAALLALFAFSAATAESVWASLCAVPPVHAAAEAPQPTGCTVSADRTAESQRSDRAPSDAPHCPFTFASGASCVAGASLPANASVQLVLSSAGDLAPFAPTVTPARLLVNTLFRPPRA
jgi:hypothetical protein